MNESRAFILRLKRCLGDVFCGRSGSVARTTHQRKEQYIMADFYIPYHKKDLESFISMHYPGVKPYIWRLKSKGQLIAIYISIMQRLQKGEFKNEK